MGFFDKLDEATKDRIRVGVRPGLVKPETPAKLGAYMLDVWGVLIPDVKICPDCSSPLEAFFLAFISKFPKDLWIGPRGGGKSFQLSALAVAKMVCFHSAGLIVAGSEDQSEAVIKTLNGDPSQSARNSGLLWEAPFAPIELLTRPRKVGSTEQATHAGGYLQAVPSSITRVRGPHPSDIYGDEIDAMHPRIYKAAMGMAAGTPERPYMGMDWVEPHVTLASTWHNANGTMTMVRDEMLDKGLPVRKWCWREVVKSNGGWLDDREVEVKRANMTKEDFAIEMDMKNPSSKDQVLTEDDVAACMPLALTNGQEFDGTEDYRVQLMPPHPKLVFIHGADWGRSRDWSVFTVLTQNPQNPEHLYLAAFERHGGGGKVDWPEIKNLWALIRRDYRGLRETGVDSDFYYALHDSTGMGGKMIDEDFFHTYGDPANGFDFSDHKNRRRIFQNLIEALQNREILMPRIKWLLRDLSRNSKNDLFGSGHPSDSFISLALSLEEWRRYRDARNKARGLVSRILFNPDQNVRTLQDLRNAMSQFGSLY